MVSGAFASHALNAQGGYRDAAPRRQHDRRSGRRLAEGCGRPGRAGEAIAEIGTDKVDVELESPADGTLIQIVVEADQVVKVGTVIARITD